VAQDKHPVNGSNFHTEARKISESITGEDGKKEKGMFLPCHKEMQSSINSVHG
jgi:hypothetical protein